MFRAGWLGYLTSFAPIDWAEEDVIAVIPFHRTFKVRPLRLLIQVARVRGTRLIVAPIAGGDQRDRYVLVRLAAILVRQMAEAVDYPQIVTSDCQDEVHNLNHGVRRVTGVVRAP